MKCPKTTADDREDLVLDIQCGTNTAMVHLSKLRQGSRAASVLFEGRWLSPNQFQCVSGRRTTKDWKRSIRHHGKTLRQLMGQGVLTVDPPTCDCGTCKGNATKENTSPDAGRSAAGKAFDSTEVTKGEATTPTANGGVVTVAATKGAGVVSALLDKSRDTQQCARAMVVELARRGDCAERKKPADLAESEKPRDILTSTTKAAERVRQVTQHTEEKAIDESVVSCDIMQKEETRNVILANTEHRTKDIASTTATPFPDMYRTAQRTSDVSPPISCDVNRTASPESDKAPTSPHAFRDVISRKSPKTGSYRHTPEVRLPCLHKVAQQASKQHVAAVNSNPTGSDNLPATLGFTAPSIYQSRSVVNSAISATRPSVAENSHVTRESPMSTVASREQAVTVAFGLYSGLMSSGLTMSNRLAESKRDLDAEKKSSGHREGSIGTPLGNTPSKQATFREKSASAMTPSGDSVRSEKRHSTSADDYSPEKRQRHGLEGGEHSPRRVSSRTPERDTVPKPVLGGSDAKPSMYPWSELIEKSNYLGGMGLDWPLARSLYASLPYSSPAAALPSYCTALCCNPYLDHVPSMPMMCGSTCQQPFCFSCHPMMPTKPMHGCLTGSFRHPTLPSAAVTPCGLLYPGHPLGYGAEHPHESAGYLKLHELAGLAPSYHGLASDALAQSLAASAAKRRLASTDVRTKTNRRCGDGTIVERPLDLSVRN